VLDLHNFSKGNNEEITNGQENDREVVSPRKGEKNDKTEDTPVQKNDGKIMGDHNMDELIISNFIRMCFIFN